jgi:hypothetical protein
VDLVNNLQNVKLLICWNELVFKYIHVKTKFFKMCVDMEHSLTISELFFLTNFVIFLPKNWEIFCLLV